MSPDFEYFIALEPYQTIGHTHMGLLLQAIPLSIMLLLLLQVIMKPLCLHLPSILHLDVKSVQLIRTFPYRSIRDWIIFLVSVVIGFYSHLFIDAFTHQTGYFVQQLPMLKNSLLGLPIYKWLQYSLSVIGLGGQFAIGLWIFVKTPTSSRIDSLSTRNKLMYWTLVLIIAATVVILKLIFTSSSNILGILIVSSISGTILGVIVASLWYRFRKVATGVRRS